MRTWQLLVWSVVVCVVAACEGAAMRPGRGVAAAEFEHPVSADGGVATSAPANPLVGAFYNDGHDGDIRARTANALGTGAQSGGAADPGKAAGTERMLVHRGEVRVEVARPEDAAREFVAKVTAWGGFLLKQQDTTMTVRVPAPHFEAAFAAAKALGRVLGESRSANDVTEEFVDLGIRLDTARKARDRLAEILQKAEKVEDILKVEAELRRLTEEIERMEGRRKFLTDQVALATLSVALHAKAPPPPPKPRERRWSRFDWINRVGAETMVEDF